MPAKRKDTPERREFMLRVRKIIADNPDVTQKEWSDRLGVSPSTLGDILLKNRLPTGDLMMNMAKVFPVDPAWLLTGQGTPVQKHRAIEQAYKDGGRTALAEAARMLSELRDGTWGDGAAAREAREAVELTAPLSPKKKQA